MNIPKKQDEIEHEIFNANALLLEKILIQQNLSQHMLPANNIKMPQWMHDFLLPK